MRRRLPEAGGRQAPYCLAMSSSEPPDQPEAYNTGAAPAPASRASLDEVRANRASVRQAAAEVEGAIASAVSPAREWVTRVERALADLSTAFNRHVGNTEAPGGLLDEMVQISPRLAHATEKLRKDHRAITFEIESLVSGVTSLHTESTDQTGEVPEDAGAGHIRRLRSEALDLLRHVSEHRHMGVDVVHDAYLVDIEAGD